MVLYGKNEKHPLEVFFTFLKAPARYFGNSGLVENRITIAHKFPYLFSPAEGFNGSAEGFLKILLKKHEKRLTVGYFMKMCRKSADKT